jgi:sec-independent protein translocase protein TatC
VEDPQLSEFNQLISKYSPYLGEIRKRILYSLIIFVAGAVLGFTFYDKIIKFLIDLLSLKGVNIVFTSPFQFINLAISCGVATGLVLAFPLLVYQVLSFLKPALKRDEFRVVLGFLPVCLLLFLGGFGLGFLIMKWQIEIFLEKSVELGIGNILDISHLISTVLLVSVLMGIAFQFPVVIFLATYIGFVKPKQISKYRLWVYLGSIVFAILLPPDSILADFFLSLPLIILFELTLITIRVFGRKERVKTALA